jgi:hypothetical protein
MMNVMLNPMTISQNVQIPSRSESIFPLIFGNQYCTAPSTAKTIRPTATKWKCATRK